MLNEVQLEKAEGLPDGSLESDVERLAPGKVRQDVSRSARPVALNQVGHSLQALLVGECGLRPTEAQHVVDLGQGNEGARHESPPHQASVPVDGASGVVHGQPLVQPGRHVRRSRHLGNDRVRELVKQSLYEIAVPFPARRLQHDAPLVGDGHGAGPVSQRRTNELAEALGRGGQVNVNARKPVSAQLVGNGETVESEVPHNDPGVLAVRGCGKHPHAVNFENLPLAPGTPAARDGAEQANWDKKKNPEQFVAGFAPDQAGIGGFCEVGQHGWFFEKPDGRQRARQGKPRRGDFTALALARRTYSPAASAMASSCPFIFRRAHSG